MMELTLTGQRAEGRGQNVRRVLVVVLLLSALCPLLCQCQRQSRDHRPRPRHPARADHHAVRCRSGARSRAGRGAGRRRPHRWRALGRCIDRVLMLNEVRRVASAGAVAPRRSTRASRASASASARPAELSRVLAARGLDETVLRLYAADDLRLASYLDERFSAAAQPTDEEIRQAGESARQRLTDERRRTLIGAWTAELRRRADVTVLP